MLDAEIRSLVVLLNSRPEFRTYSSCSGHPSADEREWSDGWITMQPVGDAARLWDFLSALCARLDSNGLAEDRYYPGDVRQSTDRVRERFRRAGAEYLFESRIPVVSVSPWFALFTRGAARASTELAWRRVVSIVQECGVPCDDDRSEAQQDAVGLLAGCLGHLPFVRSVVVWAGRKNTLGIEWEAFSDRTSCLDAWRMSDRIQALPEIDSAAATLRLVRAFALRPVVLSASVGRTRADHLAIWRLIETATRELLDDMRPRVDTKQAADTQHESQQCCCTAPGDRTRSQREVRRAPPEVVRYVEQMLINAARKGCREIVIGASDGDLFIRQETDSGSHSVEALPGGTFGRAVVERIHLMAGIDALNDASAQEGVIALRIPSLGLEPVFRVRCGPFEPAGLPGPDE